MVNFQHVIQVTRNHQNLIQAAFNTNILILYTPIWVHPNSVIRQIETIENWNSSFLIILIIMIFTLQLLSVFDAISCDSNIDKLFLINLNSKVFIFRDFSFHHKDWLNFSEELINLRKFVVVFNQSWATLHRLSLFWDCDFQSSVLLQCNSYSYFVFGGLFFCCSS